MWYILTPDFMLNHFLVSWEGLKNGRIWTLITSVFSHNMLFHIFINMYVLYGFGSVIEQVLGSKKFLRLYIISGIAGSLGHSITSYMLLDNPHLPALGASGAVSGILVFFSFMFPSQMIFLFGIIPLPAMLATILFVGSDLWGLIAQYRGSDIPIGYGAHLGGAMIGALYYLFYSIKRSKRIDIYQ